ncbi:iron chaperone [Chryseobacterium sp. Mn2064]|uniref:iron chaperone n=1 Tax=Chryseobacterium sp. Mn2064 TaxID=3395263 RepID=UPI003BCEDF17
MKNTFKNIDEYILLFPQEVQKKLTELRQFIHSLSPGFEEYIGYQMPAFRYKGKPLIYFAGYKNHIGFYPGAEGIKNFENDFKEKEYKFSKGAVQFPIHDNLPLELAGRIIQFRMNEIEQKKS